jgi:hypothetical protein
MYKEVVVSVVALNLQAGRNSMIIPEAVRALATTIIYEFRSMQLQASWRQR